MSIFNFSPDLFLELQELNRLNKFLDEEGFRSFLLDNSNSFGLIRKENEVFTNALVQEDIGLKVKINEIRALDSSGNLIYSAAQSQISVIADSNWYWIKIAHAFSTVEKGTFSIDSAGHLVCTSGDAELLTILRGQPNYASRIVFTNAVNNTAEYDLLDVVDDNHATLQGSFTSESDLTIAIVGTFTPGYAPLVSEKFPFQYDSCTLSLVLSNTSTEPTHTVGSEFFIARVKNDGSSIKIEDKRNDIWTTNANYFLHYLTRVGNPLIGVEQITFDDSLSTKDKNLVQIAWGFRSSVFTVNTKLQTVTLTAGQGGIFKTSNFATVFTNGDFDGWRLYVQTGQYFKVKTSTLNAGAIELIMDSLDAAKFFSDVNSTVPISQQLLVVPDVEEISIICNPDPAASNGIVDRTFTFPINLPYAKVRLNVYAETGTLYNIKYQYKHLKDYSSTLLIPSDTEGLYKEDQFTDQGNLIGSPVRTPYTSHLTNGFIPLALNSAAYSAFANKIDTGDSPGVEYKQLSNAAQVVQLYVTSSKTNQIFNQSSFTLTQNLYINLNQLLIDNATAIRNGNYFTISFIRPVTCGAFKVRIVQDFVAGTPTYTLLRELNQADFDFITFDQGSPANLFQGITFNCVFDGAGQWVVATANETVVSSLQTQITANLATETSHYNTNASGITTINTTLNSAWIDVSATTVGNTALSPSGTWVPATTVVKYKVVGSICHVRAYFYGTATGTNTIKELFFFAGLPVPNASILAGSGHFDASVVISDSNGDSRVPFSVTFDGTYHRFITGIIPWFNVSSPNSIFNANYSYEV